MNSGTLVLDTALRGEVLSNRFRSRMAVIGLGLALTLFVGVFIMTAWVSDDAFITFRTVSNFLKGEGLTWNTHERVQAYTHPLWMFCLAAARVMTGEFFFSAVILAFLCVSCAIYWVASEIAARGSLLAVSLFVLILSCSKAFVDFSSSGLENPLLYLILAALPFSWRMYEEGAASARVQLRRWSAITALLYVTRPDTVLITGPAVLLLILMSLRRERFRVVVSDLMMGFLPAIVWTAFSLLYYGFPFPNTAYAKLAHGIPREALVTQGLNYAWNSLTWDPVTLCTIVLGVGVGLMRGNLLLRSVAAGTALYMVYVLWIGGDFMSGRFFSHPFFVGVMIACVCLDRRQVLVVAAVALFLSLSVRASPLYALQGTSFRGIGAGRVFDERGYYYRGTGLIPVLRRGGKIEHRSYVAGVRARLSRERVVRRHAVGMYGLAAGPGVRIIDPYGLGDALLARMPAVNTQKFRIGHISRQIPEGYYQSLDSGENRIANPEIREMYEALGIVTRGPLWSWRRVVEIVRFNTGYYSIPRPGVPPASNEQRTLANG